MSTIVAILIAIIFLLISCFFIRETYLLNKKQKQMKNEQVRQNEIDKNTVEQIESITTGNMEHDFNSGIDLLHQLSQK